MNSISESAELLPSNSYTSSFGNSTLLFHPFHQHMSAQVCACSEVVSRRTLEQPGNFYTMSNPTSQNDNPLQVMSSQMCLTHFQLEFEFKTHSFETMTFARYVLIPTSFCVSPTPVFLPHSFRMCTLRMWLCTSHLCPVFCHSSRVFGTVSSMSFHSST